MKTILNLNILISKIALFIFIFISNSQLMAQNTNLGDLKDFKLVIENTKTGLNMRSIEGTAWKDLSFRLSNNQAQAIDEYGMTDLDQVSPTKDATLADFLFTITKTNKGVELKGIEGTAWETLSLTLSFDGEKFIVDQFGIKTIQ